MPFIVKCNNCNKEFNYKNTSKKFCSNECRIAYHKSLIVNYNSINSTNLSTSFVGAIAEAKVIADLISKGYEVYKGFWNTSSDLVVTKDNNKISVQIKTAHLKCNKLRTGKYLNKNHDVLALYLPQDGSIIYKPSIFN